jgi:hypothetical protein
MPRYVISSIVERPHESSQWELVTQDGRTLLLTYDMGELTLCEWEPSVDSARPNDHWREVARRQREGQTVLERMRCRQISLEDAVKLMGDMVKVNSYVASYELAGSA